MKDNRMAWILKLQSDPLWEQFIVRELMEKRPSVPNYTPSNDNTEQWKSASAMQQGFDLALGVLELNVKHN